MDGVSTFCTVIISSNGDRGAVTVFFVLDVVTQKLEGTFLLPGRSECRFLHLPQGQLLGCHDEVIYRLNPVTWEFKTVAKLQTTPRDWGLSEEKYMPSLIPGWSDW